MIEAASAFTQSWIRRCCRNGYVNAEAAAGRCLESGAVDSPVRHKGKVDARSHDQCRRIGDVRQARIPSDRANDPSADIAIACLARPARSVQEDLPPARPAALSVRRRRSGIRP